MSTTRDRVSDDYYATPESAVRAILQQEELIGSILEPSAGEGHISYLIKEYYPNNRLVSTDLIQRRDLFSCNIQGGVDFLTYDFSEKFDTIITNPPFSLAQEFIERALELSNRKVIMFAKIQLLEGKKRRLLFEKFPPKYIYVFSKRQAPLSNGSAVDENGKPWATTMCFAWFVWEHGFNGNPMVKWV